MPNAAKGLSLHIGLNSVDSTKYHAKDGTPWDGALPTCEVDAQDMRALAESQGFVSTLLLTADATADNVIGKIREAAETLTEGDIFLLTFSGHGGSVDDLNGDDKDALDETWVAYDRQIADDELYEELTRFAPGVRVVIISDSCHSGTVARRAGQDLTGAKIMPSVVVDGEMDERGELYKQIQDTVADAKMSIERLKAEVLLLSACSDEQLAYVGASNSIFTGVILGAWNKGEFQGNYRDFFQAVAAETPSKQTPQWSPPAERDPEFVGQRPFSI